MKKKIIFVDIDNTLMDYRKEIPKSAIEGIKRCREKGHLVFICTGRSRVMVPDKPVLNIGFDGIVAACGAYCEIQGKTFLDELIPDKIMEETICLLREEGMGGIFEGTSCLLYDEETVDKIKEDKFLGFLKKELGNRFLSLQERQRQKKKWMVNKVSFSMVGGGFEGLKEPLDKFYKEIRHDYHTVELVPRNFSKGTGIEFVCKKMGIDIEDTIAIGDSMNDYEMIQGAGVGIAMGNGSQAIKQCADYVTKPMGEDGLYKALEYFGLL
ncbi:MAG: Cof-type HAD-IIB family hydrolase [Lachnospiraceae bacterium]|jgi:Cof subfamily protein (haloacid dehalogenase superfamily)|nr:Cof-type HAD-IIB family hydrolase [Lachnospiraceae bacterium]